MADHLSLSELKELALSLDVTFDLSAQNVMILARELLEYVMRQDNLLELLNALGTLRPDVDWHEAAGFPSERPGEGGVEEAAEGEPVDQAAEDTTSARRRRKEPFVEPEDQGLQQLAGRIQEGKVVPLLGDALRAEVLSSEEELALTWAETIKYPLSRDEGDLLPRVAQYHRVNMGGGRMANEDFLDFLKEAILTVASSEGQIEPELLDELESNASQLTVSELAERAGLPTPLDDPESPLHLLAQLPIPLYITTSFDTLLESALKLAGKEPQSDFCRWLEEVEFHPSVFEQDPGTVPSATQPLVFHLYGLDTVPDSLVLTEDDYVDFVMALGANPDRLPAPIRQALATSSTMALGFDPTSLAYQVAHHVLIAEDPTAGRARNLFVTLLSGRLANWEDPNAMRDYLVGYLGREGFDIYWGTPRDLLYQLWQAVNE
jgi:hypothetical protein